MHQPTEALLAAVRPPTRPPIRQLSGPERRLQTRKHPAELLRLDSVAVPPPATLPLVPTRGACWSSATNRLDISTSSLIK
ncbi:hypothetical protein WN48_08321 [Eufriesea mexicana]|uniref:Uncharacterized protein n=1 Tax=Eufriesea mexicana TaxID=516756 RepID=A0A310S7X7_9HYME|nr:hypothetical protein WN48_08321 [Eufriesea mexicana]